MTDQPKAEHAETERVSFLRGWGQALLAIVLAVGTARQLIHIVSEIRLEEHFSLKIFIFSVIIPLCSSIVLIPDRVKRVIRHSKLLFILVWGLPWIRGILFLCGSILISDWTLALVSIAMILLPLLAGAKTNIISSIGVIVWFIELLISLLLLNHFGFFRLILQ